MLRWSSCGRLAWAALPLCVIACGGDDGGGRDPQGGTTAPPSSALAWGSCPHSYAGECAYLPAPLDWNEPEGDKLHVLLMRNRTRAAPEEEAPQLWFLAGGPGQSAAVFTLTFDYLHSQLPEFDFYTIEHRGIAASNQVYCDALQRTSEATFSEDLEACGAGLEAMLGDDLAFFTTTGAARDLDAALQAASTGAPQHVIGASYGTYWAERYLQITATPVPVVLDSIVPPDNRSLARWDEGFQPVVESLAALCDADPNCAAHFTSPTLEFLVGLLDKVAAGHCPELGATESELSATIANFASDWLLRELLFPLSYRYDRCSADDVRVWTYLRTGVDPGAADWRDHAETDSEALHAHVMFSELWEDPSPDAALIAERRAGARFWPGGVELFAPVYETWPRYTVDEYVGQWPTFTTPILALNGDLDALTPYDKAAPIASHLSGGSQQFLRIPYSAHSASLASLCTLQLLHEFFLQPSAAVDATCLQDELPPDLSGQFYAPSLLGLDDAWDGVPSANMRTTLGADDRPVAPAAIDWSRFLVDLRRRAFTLLPPLPAQELR